MLYEVITPLRAVPLQRIRGVGDLLQLPQDELGDEERPVEEPAVADVRDAAIDDHSYNFV